jgi:hypothetical protein
VNTTMKQKDMISAQSFEVRACEGKFDFRLTANTRLCSVLSFIINVFNTLDMFSLGIDFNN